jgi:hypothetical protein
MKKWFPADLDNPGFVRDNDNFIRVVLWACGTAKGELIGLSHEELQKRLTPESIKNKDNLRKIILKLDDGSYRFSTGFNGLVKDFSESTDLDSTGESLIK